MIRPIIGFVTILILCVVAAVPVLAGDTAMTTGEFLHQLALARQLAAVDGPDAQRLLSEEGAQLATLNLTEPLTEGTLVEILQSLGIQVTTSQPEAPIESSSIEALMVFISAQAEATEQSTTSNEPGPYPRPNDQSADPAAQGKGKKKGLPPVSESSPS
jgi:hypothetical protein